MAGAPATLPPDFRYCFIQLGVEGVVVGGGGADRPGLGGASWLCCVSVDDCGGRLLPFFLNLFIQAGVSSPRNE